MQKIAIAIAVSLIAGFAAAALMLQAPEPVAPEAAGFDSDADIEERLHALESAVSAEREARQLLEEEIFALYDELESLESSQPNIESLQARPGEVEEMINRRSARGTARGDARSDIELRRAALIEAGFSPARADWIIQRESELLIDSMQARYASRRSGEPLNPMIGGNPDFRLRTEIGDSEYETYLAANNRPTAIGVGQVFDSSPAQTAGLLPGDEITHYDGARVFSTFDLTNQTMEGDAGENVVLNITRDGVPMQLVIPRGPLGINTGRRR